ncbi:HAAS signaling domain-containing protein [Tissierella sp.]|uniref:DUF1700 domain-containing protein n=1 Tax=Tissierella sp. TaxID=41274 RepID=UPI00285B3359|nr:DUF1700 domain-containing protein [Tissierella sp.]MDR7857783.1 DUF1700 domain-containing protein [Tissierella sp.]
MNRSEYIELLKISLQGLPIYDIMDILSDYEEHFDIGISKGKSEEEISKELGDPREVADSYKANYNSSYNENSNNSNSSSSNNNSNSNSYSNSNHNDNTRKLLISLFLLFFNLIVVLGPFLGIVGLFIGLYGGSISIIIGGFVAFFGSPLVLFTPIPSPHVLTSIAFGVGLIALGTLGIILAIYLTKCFYKLAVKYVQWNIKLINN